MSSSVSTIPPSTVATRTSTVYFRVTGEADHAWRVDGVGKYLDRVVSGDAVGFISPVTLTEVHYISHYYDSDMSPDDFLGELQASGVNQVKASVCWRDAARYKREYQVALGDAYSLATAAHVDGTLLVGGDDDFEGIKDVEVVRFREGAG